MVCVLFRVPSSPHDCRSNFTAGTVASGTSTDAPRATYLANIFLSWFIFLGNFLWEARRSRNIYLTQITCFISRSYSLILEASSSLRGVQVPETQSVIDQMRRESQTTVLYPNIV